MVLAVAALRMSSDVNLARVEQPPNQASILKLAERASWMFCHQPHRDGCELSAAFLNGRWFVIATPRFLLADGKGVGYGVDADHFFLFSREGVFLGEEHGP